MPNSKTASRSSRKTASKTTKMESLLKAATTRRGNQTWVEKLDPEPLEFVRELKRRKAKGVYVAYTQALKVLREEWDCAPSYSSFQAYLNGTYDHFLDNDHK